jgi:hypothetical protein
VARQRAGLACEAFQVIVLKITIIIMIIIKGGIKIFKALARLASNSKFLLAKLEKNLPKSCLC